MTTIWFYRFPEEMPRFIPSEVKSENAARAWVRAKHEIKRIPQYTTFWTEEIETFPCVEGSEVGRLRELLKRCEIPHQIAGAAELFLLVGPVELRFDDNGRFKQLNWTDTGGPSDYHVLIRGEKHGY